MSDSVITAWISQVLNEEIGQDLTNSLKDGTVLCRLIETIKGVKIRYNKKPRMSFAMMENINTFQTECSSFGVDKTELFQTSDLFEKRNMKNVIRSLYSLARIASNSTVYDGPKLGPKMSKENKRHFSEEQIKEGRNRNISLQYGNSDFKGSGEVFGKQRPVNQ